MHTDPGMPRHFDAIVIGGSYAGLSAALQLARARRRILVIDAGLRRNRFAEHSHGFLGQDGRPAAGIVAEGRRQLLAYPNIHWHEGTAIQADRLAEGFGVETGDARYTGNRLVLATGVIDELPPIEGLAERWGRSVFHCPYCHGYELGDGPIGVLGVSEHSMHHALMLPDWAPTTFFLNESFEPDGTQLEALAARGVTLERRRVARLVDIATVELADGGSTAMAGLFALSRTRLASPIAAQLGCELEHGALGSFIRTDAMKATSVPGVAACGDAARMAGSVALAVGDGAMAGAMTHRSLMFGL